MKQKNLFFHTILFCAGVFFVVMPVIQAKYIVVDEAFIKNHFLPDGKLKMILDEAFVAEVDIEKALQQAGFIFFDIRQEKDQIVAEHPEVPGLLVKAIPKGSMKPKRFHDHLNVDRVKIAEEIRTRIEERNYHGIIVPQKYFYHIPGKGDKLTDFNYLVIVKKLDILDIELSKEKLKHLRQQQENALYDLIKHSGLSDAHTDNIVVTAQGDIAFIDTEPRRQFSDFPIIGLWLKRFRGKRGVKKFYKRLNRSAMVVDFEGEIHGYLRSLEDPVCIVEF